MTSTNRSRLLFKNSLIYVLLAIGSLIMLVPFAWMLSTSLKESYQVFTWPPKWVPDPVKWINYKTAFTSLPFGQWFNNTIIITVLSIIGAVLSCIIVSYGFARFKARGRSFLFILTLATMMLPDTVTMIPKFYMFTKFGWINTFYPLIVPLFFGKAYFVFLLRQFFMSIPADLEEAAKIDGASTFGILLRVILPLTVPAIVTITIFQFNDSWKDFMQPILYLSKPELYTLTLGINFFKSQNNVQWNYLMAASMVTMLPSLLFYFIGQKYFVESITLTGMKG